MIKDANFDDPVGLQKDDRGYTVLYRTTATLSIELTTKTAKKSFEVSGFYDFAVTADSVLSEEKRLSANKLAVIKALDAVTPVLASMGAAELNKSNETKQANEVNASEESNTSLLVNPDDLPYNSDTNQSAE